jgi:hypothetical protein
MVIVWGSRLYGKVDVVPGLFHVATRFGHVYYLPLIPLQSFVVLGQHGDEFRGVPIRLSGKSIVMAWARAFLILVALISAIIAMVNLQERDWTQWGYPALVAAASAVLFGMSMWHRSATRASFVRACALGQQIGLTEAGMAELHKCFGETAGRGFEVAPAATAATRSFPSPMPRPTPVVPVARAAAPAPAPAPAAEADDDTYAIAPDPTEAPARRGSGELGLQ